MQGSTQSTVIKDHFVKSSNQSFYAKKLHLCGGREFSCRCPLSCKEFPRAASSQPWRWGLVLAAGAHVTVAPSPRVAVAHNGCAHREYFGGHLQTRGRGDAQKHILFDAQYYYFCIYSSFQKEVYI
jgi:hypothetical protein